MSNGVLFRSSQFNSSMFQPFNIANGAGFGSHTHGSKTEGKRKRFFLAVQIKIKITHNFKPSLLCSLNKSSNGAFVHTWLIQGKLQSIPSNL